MAPFVGVGTYREGVAPSWLTRRTVLTAGLAAVGVVATSVDLSGGWKAVSIVVLAVLAVIAVVVEHVEKARVDEVQAARTRLDVQVSLVPGVVERAGDVSAFVDLWVAAEREVCLASVQPRLPAGSVLDLAELQDDGGAGGLTLDEMESIEARLAAGDSVSDSERRGYAAAKSALSGTAIAAAMAASKNLGVLGGAFSSPEHRTEEQYREEVDAYLDDVASLLRAVARWHEIDAGTSRVHVAVTNATARNYTSVEVEIYIPGDVRAVDPEGLPDLPDAPARPRAFGSRKPTGFGLAYGSELFMRGAVVPPRLRSGPVIDNGGSVRVTFPPVDLRPGDTVSLDPVHLVVPGAAASAIAGTWTATATNADGRASGSLACVVAEPTLETESVLTAWLDGEDSET